MATSEVAVVSRDNDELLTRKQVMEMLHIKSYTTYYKFKRNSGIKVMKIAGGIELLWKSDITAYLTATMQ